MRGRPISDRQRATFLKLLAAVPHVTNAAEGAGFSRRAAHDLRARDEDFAIAWDDALQQSLDDLELAAFTRATKGLAEPVVSMGKIVIDPATGRPLMIHKFSDSLTALLLKAHRPKLFNPPPAPVSYGEIPKDLQPDPPSVGDEPAPPGGIIE